MELGLILVVELVTAHSFSILHPRYLQLKLNK